jgi:hypothetical protein
LSVELSAHTGQQSLWAASQTRTVWTWLVTCHSEYDLIWYTHKRCFR